jgi:hypothetical protein
VNSSIWYIVVPLWIVILILLVIVYFQDKKLKELKGVVPLQRKALGFVADKGNNTFSLMNFKPNFFRSTSVILEETGRFGEYSFVKFNYNDGVYEETVKTSSFKWEKK